MPHCHYSFNPTSCRELVSFKASYFFRLGNGRIILAGKERVTRLPWHKLGAMLTKALGILHIRRHGCNIKFKRFKC